jgi:hypothetical protein
MTGLKVYLALFPDAAALALDAAESEASLRNLVQYLLPERRASSTTLSMAPPSTKLT